MSAIWHYAINGQTNGPVTAKELKQLADSGQLKPTDTVWKEGMTDWAPAAKLKGLFATGAAVAGRAPGTASVATTERSTVVKPLATDEGDTGTPDASSAIEYYNATSGIPQRVATALKGYASATGPHGEWPLSDLQAAEFVAAVALRKPIRSAAVLYNSLGGLLAIIAAIFLIISLGVTTTTGGSRGMMAGAYFGGAMAIMVAMIVLYFICSRFTRRCHRWAPLTMFILFTVGAVLDLVSVAMAGATQPEAAVGPIVGIFFAGAFALVSWKAYAAIPKYLTTALWCQEIIALAKQ